MKARIFSTSTSGFYGQMLNGFTMYRNDIRSRLRLDFHVSVFTSLSDLLQKMSQDHEDIHIVIPHFTDSPDGLATVLQAAREHSTRRVILLDGHDQTSSPHFPLLPYVDTYIKSKMLRDPKAYQREFLGGYIFSDFYSRKYSFDLNGWNFGTKPDPAYGARIVPGWNFGVVRSCRWLARLSRIMPKPLVRRKFDVNIRIPSFAGDKDWEWYEDYRASCKRAIDDATSGLVVTNDGLTGRLSFLRELRDAKMVFSPFGWGEVCMRDYESVASGALLIKPDCGHLRTRPDIFVKGVTYVPVRWDLADLGETIQYYLTNIDEAQQIATNGVMTLYDYFEAGGFLDDVRRTIMQGGHRD